VKTISARGLQSELLAELGIAVVGTDLHGTIRTWNAAAALLYGREAEEMLGASVGSVRLSEGDDLIAALIAGELVGAGLWKGELLIQDGTGLPLRLDVRAIALVDEAGERVGYEAVLLDVSGKVRAEQRAQDRGARLQLAHRIAGLGSWEWDIRDDRLVTSDAFTLLLGLEWGVELTMTDALGAMPASDRQRVQAALDGMREDGHEAFTVEYRAHGTDGTVRWLEAHCGAVRGADGVLTHVRGITQDVTARIRAAERLREAKEQAVMQAALLDEIDVAVIVTDPDMKVVSWNTGAERLYEWTAEEAIGQNPGKLEAPGNEQSAAPILAALHRDGRWDGEYSVSRKDGSTFPAYIRNRVMLDQDGHVKALVGVSMDISERKESERALLSARNYLRAVTDSMAEAVWTADCDGRLTYLNQAAEDLLGWALEDVRGQLMHELVHSRRRDGSPLPVEECPILRARRDGEVVRVEDDIFIRRDGSELPVAYTAAPFATDDGIEGCVVVFEDITERNAAAQRVERDLEKLAWVDRIQSALSEKRFVLHAQPIIDLRTGEVAQSELLLRMRAADSASGLIMPCAFLPVAEEYGLITEIDRWVIDRASEIAATGKSVEVNVSGRTISDPSLVDYVQHAIARAGADPGAMVFEITETTVASDERAAQIFVERLHELGCQVALYDFGTGYGGFTYLKQLSIDYLKIDIEFVRDLRENSASRHVVLGIVNLAQSFSLKTVGEGVEDQETLELLRELGVDYAQGFHIGRPSPLHGGVPSAPALAAAGLNPQRPR